MIYMIIANICLCITCVCLLCKVFQLDNMFDELMDITKLSIGRVASLTLQIKDLEKDVKNK